MKRSFLATLAALLAFCLVAAEGRAQEGRLTVGAGAGYGRVSAGSGRSLDGLQYHGRAGWRASRALTLSLEGGWYATDDEDPLLTDLSFDSRGIVVEHRRPKVLRTTTAMLALEAAHPSGWYVRPGLGFGKHDFAAYSTEGSTDGQRFTSAERSSEMGIAASLAAGYRLRVFSQGTVSVEAIGVLSGGGGQQQRTARPGDPGGAGDRALAMSLLTRLFGAGAPASVPPSLPLLEYQDDAHPADWLRASMTTFALGVRSFLPDRFEAYARIHHPFERGIDGTLHSWRELSPDGPAQRGPAAAEEFAYHGWEGGQARAGGLPLLLIDPLVEHLRPATTTPDRCFFAVWEGYGDLALPYGLEPTLDLPERRYHLFAGPIEGARTSFAVTHSWHQSGNLWWPADRAWCVATEVDFAWTYVGGPRACIDAILSDPRLETVETTATARW